ncbi:MAG TPA: cytosine permease [Actinomycetes bacterium]|nr:cytosine permease [Actinomycetes bacterium]
MDSVETPSDQPTVHGGSAPVIEVVAEVREGTYGDRVATVEPGGAGLITEEERHGRPINLFWTWLSPNLEFATVFVGVIAVLYFGLTFWQAVSAIVLGTGLGAFFQVVLAARGPELGAPQMIVSRIPFGFFGNILPAGLNSLVAGVGWFAVNSVSGALALNSLISIPKPLALLIIAVVQIAIAFLGHNLIHVFERYASYALLIIFAVTSIVILDKAHSHLGAASSGHVPGGWLIALGATFGYAAGWNPYATDYTRYLPRGQGRAAGLWSGAGIFVSCVLLETVGAASALLATNSKGSPTDQFVSHLSSTLGNLTLLAIVVGAISANAINVYSGSMSFLALGIELPLKLRRAIVAAVFGTAGFLLAWSGLHDEGQKYENFLLVISYWIGPWLGVVIVDQYLRRRHVVSGYLYDRKHNPVAGFVAMALAMIVSITLFSNQTEYVGWVPKHHPGFGDITFEVGFVIAALVYWAIYSIEKSRRPEPDEVLVLPS